MTTNLKSIAGTDFDDLFEAGAGNQLLNIYAMDGQDVGQKYLNVSQGSQVSANTGFQASDSADVKTKLCGKGTNKAGVSYRVYQTTESRTVGDGEYFYYQNRARLDIQITNSKSCTVAGSFKHTYVSTSGRFGGTVHTASSPFNKTINSSGTINLYMGDWEPSRAGRAESFSGTITCGSFSVSFNNSSPSGSF